MHRPLVTIAMLGLLAACTTHVDVDTLLETESGGVSAASDDATPTTTDPVAVCSDGVVQAPTEECDDADHDNTDACLDTCKHATCGDGFVQAVLEICDDAGVSPTCDADCTGASCGDGFVNAMAGEVCDDGNTVGGDGCEAACDATEPWPSRFVFVTSLRYNGDLGGLTGADAKCQAAADAAGLPGTYMAWLSDDTGEPTTRMTHSKGPYVLPDGTRVADNWMALTLLPSKLLHAIDMTEHKTMAPLGPPGCTGPCTHAWSNTTEIGLESHFDEHCTNWSVPEGLASVGNWTATDGYWSGALSTGCAEVLSLYCFQQ